MVSGDAGTDDANLSAVHKNTERIADELAAIRTALETLVETIQRRYQEHELLEGEEIPGPDWYMGSDDEPGPDLGASPETPGDAK